MANRNATTSISIAGNGRSSRRASPNARRGWRRSSHVASCGECEPFFLAGSTSAGDAGDSMRPGSERLHISDKLGSIAIEVLARCDEVARFSEEPDKITRTFLSEPMRRLHERMTDWMEEAGLSVRARRGGQPDRPLRRASSRTRPSWRSARTSTPCPMPGSTTGCSVSCSVWRRCRPWAGAGCRSASTSIAFSEEEGVRYRRPYLGSLAVAGRFDRRLLERTDADGVTMADAFRSFGLDPARIDEAAYPAGRTARLTWRSTSSRDRSWKRWGRRSGWSRRSPDRAGSGPSSRGRAGHAGTMPMEGRLDALAGGGGAGAGGRAARPIDRGPAGDGRHARRRARRRPT